VIQFVNAGFNIIIVSIVLGVPTGIAQRNLITRIFDIQLEVRNPRFFYTVPFGSFFADYTTLIVIAISITQVTE